MADKHVKLNNEGSILLNKCRAIIQKENPEERVTDEKTVVKTLELYIKTKGENTK